MIKDLYKNITLLLYKNNFSKIIQYFQRLYEYLTKSQ